MSAERIAPGAVLGQRFQLERLAGTGGMGTVYRALDVATGQPVAVKVLLRSADTARFARESRLLEGVRHPGWCATSPRAPRARASRTWSRSGSTARTSSPASSGRG